MATVGAHNEEGSIILYSNSYAQACTHYTEYKCEYSTTLSTVERVQIVIQWILSHLIVLS